MRPLRHPSLALVLLLAGCASAPRPSVHRPAPPVPMPAPVVNAPVVPLQPAEAPPMPAANSGRGAYYQDDGPGDNPPPGLITVPDAELRNEPYSQRSNRPYVVLGKTYVPIMDERPFVQRGLSTWYGKKFHGQRTSSGETYDMYKMTAAHPTLPIPSYARVRSVSNGKEVIVRINDRGPFHPTRIIDVSYTAALKLGLLGAGSMEVEVERILPAEIERLSGRPRAEPPDDLEALIAANRPKPVPEIVVSARAPETAPVGHYYLQLGAFTRLDNAQAASARLAQYGGALASLEVSQSGNLHRLYSGPFATRAEATEAAQNLPVALGLKPIVVQR